MIFLTFTALANETDLQLLGDIGVFGFKTDGRLSTVFGLETTEGVFILLAGFRFTEGCLTVAPVYFKTADLPLFIGDIIPLSLEVFIFGENMPPLSEPFDMGLNIYTATPDDFTVNFLVKSPLELFRELGIADWKSLPYLLMSSSFKVDLPPVFTETPVFPEICDWVSEAPPEIIAGALTSYFSFYYFSLPMPKLDFIVWLNSTKPIRPSPSISNLLMIPISYCLLAWHFWLFINRFKDYRSHQPFDSVSTEQNAFLLVKCGAVFKSTFSSSNFLWKLISLCRSTASCLSTLIGKSSSGSKILDSRWVASALTNWSEHVKTTCRKSLYLSFRSLSRSKYASTGM